MVFFVTDMTRESPESTIDKISAKIEASRHGKEIYVERIFSLVVKGEIN
mgnify:CR=1 FL=1